MSQTSEETEELHERILKDINKFSESLELSKNAKFNAKEKEIMELAKMYAEDSKAWLAKKDYYTAFASISYAHGLADAILKIQNLKE